MGCILTPSYRSSEARDAARREGRPQAELVREALDEYLRGRPRPKPQSTRIRSLVRRYEDLPLGFADAAVIVCAEGKGGQVLTFDRRDFEVGWCSRARALAQQGSGGIIWV